MTEFDTRRLPRAADVVAPDGSDVRVLLALDGGSMAHFTLAPGQTSRAVTHRTVEEIWYVLAGRGEMWRQSSAREAIVPLEPGVCVTIPAGTRFQFRAAGDEALAAVAVTMPPWPGDGEAVEVAGAWPPTARPRDVTTVGTIRIRPLGAADAAAFQALRLEGLLESPSAFASSHEEERDTPLATVAERLGDPAQGCVIGAFEGPRLAGVLGLRRERMRKLAHKAHLWGMYVDPPARRLGVGRRLVTRALEEAARMTGVRQVTLGVNAANVPAIRLYEALGFTAFGHERECLMIDGVPHDELHMVRRVDP